MFIDQLYFRKCGRLKVLLDLHVLSFHLLSLLFTGQSTVGRAVTISGR